MTKSLANRLSISTVQILFRDEDVELCKGHIVNQAFDGMSRHWEIQRADVDNFYGSCFESDFVDIQHKGSVDAACIADRKLAARFRPQISRKGVLVPYYYPSGKAPTPPGQSKMELETAQGIIELRLKMAPADVEASGPNEWEIRVEKDMRLPALVSLLKAAHLTMFRMLGYRYVFSAGGHMLGSSLGSFFTKNRGKDKGVVVENAKEHFREFANLVRPVHSHKPRLEGTVADNKLYICETTTNVPWSVMVFVRTGETLHAVLVPICEHQDGVARCMTVMQSDGGRVEGKYCHYENGVFKAWPRSTVFQWPKGGLHDQGGLTSQ